MRVGTIEMNPTRPGELARRPDERRDWSALIGGGAQLGLIGPERRDFNPVLKGPLGVGVVSERRCVD